MTYVALLRCTRYDDELLKRTIADGLEKIGFDFNLLKKARVALKPNLLMAAAIDRAVVTHPSFFNAVAQIVIENGGIPILAESPGFGSLEGVMKKVGYRDIVQELRIEVARIRETDILHNTKAKTFKRVEISKVFFNADMILNLPKFKTHGLTYISGAVKNLFGTVPGLKKSHMHMRCPQSEEFSEWLLDLYSALVYGFDKPKPIFTIMDAIIGLEGEGPGPSGKPRQIGAVIIGQDPVAVDYVATGVVGLDHKKVYTITLGFERDFAVSSPQDIQIVGEMPQSMRIKNFTPTRTSISSHFLRGPLVGTLAKNLIVQKPWPGEEKCTLCYKCKTICPANAISRAREGKKIPAYDYRKCIRCFCCMEICPEAAISLKKGPLHWLLG
jgi:uncharacterized protein (DUF362 family)/Pyruvate/2-oxoacid:ferredoxin oxidoreductase delta subunit